MNMPRTRLNRESPIPHFAHALLLISFCLYPQITPKIPKTMPGKGMSRESKIPRTPKFKAVTPQLLSIKLRFSPLSFFTMTILNHRVL